MKVLPFILKLDLFSLMAVFKQVFLAHKIQKSKFPTYVQMIVCVTNFWGSEFS